MPTIATLNFHICRLPHMYHIIPPRHVWIGGSVPGHTWIVPIARCSHWNIPPNPLATFLFRITPALNLATPPCCTPSETMNLCLLIIPCSLWMVWEWLWGNSCDEADLLSRLELTAQPSVWAQVRNNDDQTGITCLDKGCVAACPARRPQGLQLPLCTGRREVFWGGAEVWVRGARKKHDPGSLSHCKGLTSASLHSLDHESCGQKNANDGKTDSVRLDQVLTGAGGGGVSVSIQFVQQHSASRGLKIRQIPSPCGKAAADAAVNTTSTTYGPTRVKGLRMLSDKWVLEDHCWAPSKGRTHTLSANKKKQDGRAFWGMSRTKALGSAHMPCPSEGALRCQVSSDHERRLRAVGGGRLHGVLVAPRALRAGVH